MGLYIYPDGRTRGVDSLRSIRRALHPDGPMRLAVRIWQIANAPAWAQGLASGSRSLASEGVIEIETDVWTYRDAFASYGVLRDVLRTWRNLHGTLLWVDGYFVGEVQHQNLALVIDVADVAPEIDAVARFFLEQAKRLYDHFGVRGCQYVSGPVTSRSSEENIICRDIWDGFRHGTVSALRPENVRDAFYLAWEIAEGLRVKHPERNVLHAGLEAARAYTWWRGR